MTHILAVLDFAEKMILKDFIRNFRFLTQKHGFYHG